MSENAPTRSLDDIDLAALRVSYRVCTCMFTCLHLSGAFPTEKTRQNMITVSVVCFKDMWN